jgi:hypothetical protein
MSDRAFRRPSEPTRRGFLQAGALAGLGVFWSGWRRAAAAGAPAGGKARSIILIFNCGGPSHLDLWDPKPEAPENVRGPFRAIPTSVPGIRVSELLPNLARRAHRYAIVRSVHHEHQNHNSAMYWSIVGRPYPIDSTLINPSRTDLPSFGTLTGWLAQRDGYSGAVPPYVITPAPHCDSTAYVTPGQFGACLGAKYDPFVLNADPNAPDFKLRDIGPVEGMTPDRLAARRELLKRLEVNARPVETPVARELDVYHARAFSMVLSGEMARAFDLSREPDRVRERYGRHSWGQSHLLARRLVEAGARFVTTVNGPSIVWDTHKDNFEQMRRRLVPPMEQAFTALLDDLAERGLLETTIVLWMGDFGRTPVINNDAGRDHWPQCFSMVLAGGGIRGGQVVGASDSKGAYPSARPVSPADIHATVFTLLGYDPAGITFPSSDGRPMALSEGAPIRELI